jgi:hypothetical protein
MLTDHEASVLAGLSLAADRQRLRRVARLVLSRDDAVGELVRACALNGEDGRSAWREACGVLERRGGNALNLLDLTVEVGQQDRERRGESRTWTWPARNGAT